MPTTKEMWKGIISIHQKRGWYIGKAGLTEPHTPHAIKICFVADGSGSTFHFRIGESEIWNSCQAVIFAPDQMQQIDGCGKTLGLFYLMPETAEAHKLTEKYLNHKRGFEVISRDLVADLSSRLLSVLNRWNCSNEESVDLGDHLTHSLKISPSISWRESFDKRVLRAVEYIQTKFADKIPVEEISRFAFASVSTLAHKFKEHTNLAIRRYQVWVKLQEAVKCMAFTKDLKYIAHASGFTDYSHINKWFREMHGITPSALAEHCKVFDYSEA